MPYCTGAGCGTSLASLVLEGARCGTSCTGEPLEGSVVLRYVSDRCRQCRLQEACKYCRLLTPSSSAERKRPRIVLPPSLRLFLWKNFFTEGGHCSPTLFAAYHFLNYGQQREIIIDNIDQDTALIVTPDVTSTCAAPCPGHTPSSGDTARPLLYRLCDTSIINAATSVSR